MISRSFSMSLTASSMCAHARIAEVEGNADDRLLGGAAPFVGQVAERPEVVEAGRLELGVEAADVLRDRRFAPAEAPARGWEPAATAAPRAEPFRKRPRPCREQQPGRTF